VFAESTQTSDAHMPGGDRQVQARLSKEGYLAKQSDPLISLGHDTVRDPAGKNLGSGSQSSCRDPKIGSQTLDLNLYASILASYAIHVLVVLSRSLHPCTCAPSRVCVRCRASLRSGVAVFGDLVAPVRPEEAVIILVCAKRCRWCHRRRYCFHDKFS
jgi:hypothetical protein